MSEQGHLAKQIALDLKAAMKARDDKLRVATLRLMQAAIKDRDIQARSEDRCCGLSDDEVRQVLTKMVKQREDSARTYEDAGRIEMAEQERAENEVIRGYLPKQMDSAEIENTAREASMMQLRDFETLRWEKLVEECVHDKETQEIVRAVKNGFPSKREDASENLKKVWHCRTELYQVDSVPIINNRMYIPKAL